MGWFSKKNKDDYEHHLIEKNRDDYEHHLIEKNRETYNLELERWKKYYSLIIEDIKNNTSKEYNNINIEKFEDTIGYNEYYYEAKSYHNFSFSYKDESGREWNDKTEYMKWFVEQSKLEEEFNKYKNKKK